VCVCVCVCVLHVQEKQGFGAWSGMSARDGLLKDPEGGSAVEGEERDDKTPHGSYQLVTQTALRKPFLF